MSVDAKLGLSVHRQVKQYLTPYEVKPAEIQSRHHGPECRGLAGLYAHLPPAPAHVLPIPAYVISYLGVGAA